MDEWEIPFAEAIDRAKKYVVSSTLSGVDWNAELVRGDFGQGRACCRRVLELFVDRHKREDHRGHRVHHQPCEF